MPSNYRKQIAEFMRTQRDSLGLVQLFRSGIKKGGAEISDPNRAFSWLGTRDWVCVRFGGGSWPNFSTVRAYGFNGGQLDSGTGNIVSQYGQGALTELMACGTNPNFKPFPEAEFQPQAKQADIGLNGAARQGRAAGFGAGDMPSAPGAEAPALSLPEPPCLFGETQQSELLRLFTSHEDLATFSWAV